MTQLSDKLQRATEGSRELDDLIWRQVNEWQQAKGRGWKYDLEFAPHYTTNLQDAVSLVPEGCLWRIGHVGDHRPGIFLAVIMPPKGASIEGESSDPALALCIAIIKASSKAEAA